MSTLNVTKEALVFTTDDGVVKELAFPHSPAALVAFWRDCGCLFPLPKAFVDEVDALVNAAQRHEPKLHTRRR